MIIQLVLFSAFSNISKKSVKLNSINILVMLLYSFFEIFLSFFVSVPINGLTCFAYFYWYLKWTMKLDFKDIVFYIFILWLLGIGIDILFMLIVSLFNVFVVDVSSYYDLMKPVASIIMAILLQFMSKNVHVKHIISNLYVKFKSLKINSFKISLILLVYLLIDIVCIININNGYNFVILFSVTILITYILYCRYEIASLKITNDLILKNNKFYIKVIDDYHLLKHNLINQLLGLKTVSTKKAKLIIDDLIKEYNSSFKTVKNVKDIPDGLSGLVFEKVYNYINEGLNIVVDNKLRDNIFLYLTPRNYNVLCESLGITLDNALESSVKSDKKILYLQFYENKNEIIVVLINSFAGFIDLEKLGNFKYTSKDNGHGYGLFSLFLKRNLNIKTYIKNDLFKVELKIVKKR